MASGHRPGRPHAVEPQPSCSRACPYGCRFINPLTKTTEKRTLCYHRITRGLKPARPAVAPYRASRGSGPAPI